MDSQPDSSVTRNRQTGRITFLASGLYKPRGREDTQAQGLSPLLSPSLLSDASVMDLNNLSANLTNITSSFAEKPSLATLATVLLSFTGLQDWIKLFLIGGVFETCRRLVLQAWYELTDSLWVSVDFEEGDDSHGESPVHERTARAQH